MEFRIKIAGQTGAVSALFESTAQYFRHYLTEDAPDFSVTVTPNDLVFEQAELDEEARLEGFRRRQFTNPFLERTAIGRAFAERLFDLDTLLVHGSAIAVDDAAYLFVARSGTGKSTHTRFWREQFGLRARMINDDKPFLRLTPNAVLCCGSPWSGKHGLDCNIQLPLAGICLLERGSENQIDPLSTQDALPMLQRQSYQPLDPAKAIRFAALVTSLTQSVPLWRMECTKDPQAAQVAYGAMSQA
ncbi:MAG: hypothetical protein IKY59_06600 [Oscillospiraceae bacterium]|nr:hypothetical protein [Oscillospiraceae bacterium]